MYIPSQVGGLQLKDAKPLEGDLKKFMDSATEGAVLVSFGSSLKPDQMPQEKIQVFIDTFKQLGMKVNGLFVSFLMISFLCLRLSGSGTKRWLAYLITSCLGLDN